MRRISGWLAGIAALVLVGGVAFGGFVAWSFVTARVDTVGTSLDRRELLEHR